jgi:sigma-B regulation protein RsbU (phosphoserine phosphatase)
MIFSAFPDLRMHGDELLIVGDRAVWTLAIQGTDNGGFMGLPPTGKPLNTSGIFLYTFGPDDRIVRELRVHDFGRLLMQLAGESVADGPRLYRELLDRAQHEHELKTAAEIQRALLPHAQHGGAGFEVAGMSLPCRAIGGDFFDYFDLLDGAFAFVIGDVAGKGPPAALLAAALQGIFTANSRRGGTPATTICEANEALLRRAIPARFATVLYAELLPNGRLTYCNAGHNPALLVGKGGVQRLETGGLPVGAFEHATFDEETLQLEPDDVLVAFSDGLTEARNTDGEEFGEERLLTCVRAYRELAPTALLESLLGAVRQFSGDTAPGDDLTVLVLRYSGATVPAA